MCHSEDSRAAKIKLKINKNTVWGKKNKSAGLGVNFLSLLSTSSPVPAPCPAPQKQTTVEYGTTAAAGVVWKEQAVGLAHGLGQQEQPGPRDPRHREAGRPAGRQQA